MRRLTFVAAMAASISLLTAPPALAPAASAQVVYETTASIRS